MSTEEHEFTIHVDTGIYTYDGNNNASVTLTFTSNDKSVKLEYTSYNGMHKIMPLMLKDIEACMSNPDKWITEVIKQGPDTIEKLRVYEQEVAATKLNIASHQDMIEIESKRVEIYQKKVDELKEKIERETPAKKTNSTAVRHDNGN